MVIDIEAAQAYRFVLDELFQEEISPLNCFLEEHTLPPKVNVEFLGELTNFVSLPTIVTLYTIIVYNYIFILQ